MIGRQHDGFDKGKDDGPRPSGMRCCFVFGRRIKYTPRRQHPFCCCYRAIGDSSVRLSYSCKRVPWMWEHDSVVPPHTQAAGPLPFVIHKNSQ